MVGGGGREMVRDVKVGVRRTRWVDESELRMELCLGSLSVTETTNPIYSF
jgi:hypothetical protein